MCKCTKLCINNIESNNNIKICLTIKTETANNGVDKIFCLYLLLRKETTCLVIRM